MSKETKVVIAVSVGCAIAVGFTAWYVLAPFASARSHLKVVP